jgi:hypothetical protein
MQSRANDAARTKVRRKERRRAACASLLAGGASVLLGAGLCLSDAHADEWEVFGARYQGMGGAAVAVADGAAAAYWNPGALAFATPLIEVDAPFGASVSAEGGLLDTANRLSDFFEASDFEDVLDKVQDNEQLTDYELAQTVSFFVDKLPGFDEHGLGGFARANAGLNLRRGSWVLTGAARGVFGGDPDFDGTNLDFVERSIDADALIGPGMDRSADFDNDASQSLADSLAVSAGLSQNQAEELVFQAERGGIDTASPGVQQLITNLAASSGNASGVPNGTGALVRGFYTKQVGIAWGSHVLPKRFGERLGLGVHLQGIHGTTIRKFIGVEDGQDSRIGTENRRRARRLSLDVGMLYEATDWLRLGVSARRINAPSFPTVDGSPIRLRPQVRFGSAVYLSSRWLIAADLDLTENESDLVDGFRSRVLALGTEYRGSFLGRSIDFRLGAHRNLATGPNRDIVITLGIGLYFGNFRFDLAFGSGLDREYFEQVGSELPRRVDLSTGIRWITEF